MKKHVILLVTAAILSFFTNAQSLRGILKNTGKKDSSGNTIANVLKKGTVSKGSLTNEEIISGLKEALAVGTGNAAQKLSLVDGFFKDAAIKILMPAEAQKVERTLRNMGMGKQVDNAILSMNRAAEDAAKQAAPIFINAVKEMSFQDALGILRGGDFAATNFLKEKTTLALTEAFRPVIDNSVEKVGATKYWNTIFTTYNKFSSEKVNTDLSAYVTEKALAGLFYQLSLEEQMIRKDPFARTSDILKKVFAN
ncbi:MAG TPA: DUF4197 domain-containing protein [Chitinophagaceae bacterium]|nr:DUF4197 domain-containing protein [Chitinophagaceae bacterium]